ncbi:hypothetical protein [Yoonia sp. 208BN28-4]|uniref:hypothetical protein n=1 Tax=Yoonia sp. 208BN28-4 TaxID=3126505 RepID=UPI0030953AC7
MNTGFRGGVGAADFGGVTGGFAGFGGCCDAIGSLLWLPVMAECPPVLSRVVLRDLT